MDLSAILAVVAALLAHLPSVVALESFALAAAPYAFYLAIACVLAIDVLDVDLYRLHNKGRWPSIATLWSILSTDVADKAIWSVAVAAALVGYAATGDKVLAAKAAFVVGVAGSLAVEEAYLRAKLIERFGPKAAELPLPTPTAS